MMESILKVLDFFPARHHNSELSIFLYQNSFGLVINGITSARVDKVTNVAKSRKKRDAEVIWVIVKFEIQLKLRLLALSA